MRDTRARLLCCIAIAIVVGLPGLALACAVCQPGTEENRFAFIATTAFMTALPLSVVGAIVWWLRGRAIEMRGDEPQASRSAERVGSTDA